MQPESRESSRDTPVPPTKVAGSERIGRGQLLPRGVIVLTAAAVVNLLILAIARSLMEVDPAFKPFSAPRVAVFTVLGVGVGLAIALIMNRSAKRPLRTFRWTILVLLALSLLPDIGLLAGDSPRATLPAVASLMLMHLAEGAIFIGLIIVPSKPA